MTSLWWQMPGPNHFVGRVADALRSGRNVVLGVPEHAPHGLREAVRTALGEDWPWCRVKLPGGENPLPPLKELWLRFGPKDDVAAWAMLKALLACPAWQGQVIWIEGFTAQNWPAWRDFLSLYQNACRAVSLHQRTLLCCLVTGAEAGTPPTEDICLVSQSWRGVVETWDTWLFAAHLWRKQAGTPNLRQRLAIAIAAHLALWDATLIERMVAEDLETLLMPHEWLCQIAHERGWTRQTAARWHTGTREDFEGAPHTHSALLAIQEIRDELAQRIWRAQVSVLLPLAEERRRSFIKRAAHLLRVPFRTQHDKLITHINDLELGHLNAQLGQLAYAEVGLRRSVETWLAVRNRLAHLELVPLELLLKLED